MFSPEDKIAAFDKITEKFYKRNFGQTSNVFTIAGATS